jgi:acyl-coenzyme A thioesterase PaaI-like protein
MKYCYRTNRTIPTSRETALTTEPERQPPTAIADPTHAHCLVCGTTNPCGLNIRFYATDDDAVEATFQADECFQGYRRMMHGGFISLLLDGAMTNCLLARGLTAVTAKMDVSFRHPVDVNQAIVIRARITQENHPVYRLEASVTQQAQVKANAKGVFMNQANLKEPEQQP